MLKHLPKTVEHLRYGYRCDMRSSHDERPVLVIFENNSILCARLAPRRISLCSSQTCYEIAADRGVDRSGCDCAVGSEFLTLARRPSMSVFDSRTLLALPVGSLGASSRSRQSVAVARP